MNDQDRDRVISEFERGVRHDATVNRMKTIYRLRALRGSSRRWWTIRTLLRERRGKQ